MRVPLSWLRDFAPIEVGPDDLGATLDDLGLVVESIERVGEGLDGVVVARVLAIDPIPSADLIRRVTVDAGDGRSVEVVCGAFNFAVGDLVPLATVGTSLPEGPTVTRRRMKGVESNGMLCSGKELGLSEDSAGILVLGPSAGDERTGVEPGAPLTDALGIEPDVVFGLEVEGNRPDALSMVGVARDVAARLGLPFSIPDPRPTEGKVPTAHLARAAVEAADLCPRLHVRVLVDVEGGASPPWMTRRLVLAGMRPINSIVDASNYVMLELGQPTHPYDLDRLGGHGLLVRRARPGETIVTLDGEERQPTPDDCLICDADGTPVGIAGIMGGATSEISATTSRVLLEVAHFAPMAIAGTSARLGLRTEASVRFERGAVTAAGSLDVRGELAPPPVIRLRTDRVNAILGTDLDDATVRRQLTPLGFETSVESPGVHQVRVPTFRPDSTREVDLIEEVARLNGYSKIPRTVPAPPGVGRLTPYQRDRRRVRQVLTGAGANEAWTASLLSPGDHAAAGLTGPEVEVENPLASEESVLRRTLLPGLLRSLAYNASHRYPDLRLFEVGHVFGWPRPGEQLPDETEHVGVALAWPEDDARSAVDVWRALAAAVRLEPLSIEPDSRPGLHPTRSARLVVPATGAELGGLGEVDPDVLDAFGLGGRGGRVGWIEVDLGLLLAAPRRPLEAQPVSRFPSSDVDLAFVVDDATPAGAVEETLARAGGDLLVRLTLFDVYRGEGVAPGRRSLAFRLRFCALDHTLTDEEVGEARRRCIEAVESSHPAALRGG
ncbi:MAG: phenylalanine--tRNA ligase subunit beta [Actinobacteria bacterium]|nr:MAG: phenylalanine--tRNA ligase subunit beta [Actinomycetota bacterium]